MLMDIDLDKVDPRVRFRIRLIKGKKPHKRVTTCNVAIIHEIIVVDEPWVDMNIVDEESEE